MEEKVWRKGSPVTAPLGMDVGTATVEDAVEVPQKSENRITIGPSNPSLGRALGQNSNSKEYMQPRVHSSTIHNGQNVETTSISIDR